MFGCYTPRGAEQPLGRETLAQGTATVPLLCASLRYQCRQGRGTHWWAFSTVPCGAPCPTHTWTTPRLRAAQGTIDSAPASHISARTQAGSHAPGHLLPLPGWVLGRSSQAAQWAAQPQSADPRMPGGCPESNLTPDFPLKRHFLLTPMKSVSHP